MPRNAYYSGFKHINFVEATINPSIIFTLIIFEFLYSKVIKIFKLMYSHYINIQFIVLKLTEICKKIKKAKFIYHNKSSFFCILFNVLFYIK